MAAALGDKRRRFFKKKERFMIIWTLVFTAALVGVDQLLKIWAESTLSQVESIPFIPGVLDFHLLYNDGAAFSMLAGKQTFLIAFTAVVLLVLLGYLLSGKWSDKLEYASLVLILGGGIGNLIDRVRNQMVVDYIRTLFIEFPIFNFADICVCTGVGLLALSLILEEVKERKRKKTGDENN